MHSRGKHPHHAPTEEEILHGFGARAADLATPPRPEWTCVIGQRSQNGEPWALEVTYRQAERPWVVIQTFRPQEHRAIGRVSLPHALAAFATKAAPIAGSRANLHASQQLEPVLHEVEAQVPTRDQLVIGEESVRCSSLSYKGHHALLARIEDLTVVCVSAAGLERPHTLKWIE